MDDDTKFSFEGSDEVIDWPRNWNGETLPERDVHRINSEWHRDKFREQLLLAKGEKDPTKQQQHATQALVHLLSYDCLAWETTDGVQIMSDDEMEFLQQWRDDNTEEEHYA